MKKLFFARSNLQSELRNIHEDITEAKERQGRRVKVKGLFSKLNVVFHKLMQKNEEMFGMASKTENPDSKGPIREQGLVDAIKNKDKLLLGAVGYIDSFADRDTICQVVKP